MVPTVQNISKFKTNFKTRAECPPVLLTLRTLGYEGHLKIEDLWDYIACFYLSKKKKNETNLWWFVDLQHTFTK